ncbi:endocuticle structural glycoprotein ABD-5-like [Photinus pyralis]|uniref:Uncharacterized protein n=1 Tax=Photinus pyralis TaxID=7054 RepID=A0A1Y1JY61_PHOPY|nr:endocuticle structural glycoprotein ABD-5-like [Photinus pyralis]
MGVSKIYLLFGYKRRLQSQNQYTLTLNCKRIMKTVLLILPILAVALARPQSPESQAKIVRYENENDGITGYKFGFDTENSISRDEQGTLKNPGAENAAMEVHGQSSYTDNTGKKVSMTYVADENGFRPRFTIS